MQLTLDFFGAKGAFLGLVPLVYLLLHWVRGHKEREKLTEVAYLATSYLIVGLIVFVWKFAKAPGLLKREDQRRAFIGEQLSRLDPVQLLALEKLALRGTATNYEIQWEMPEQREDVLGEIQRATGLLEHIYGGYFKIKEPLQPLVEEMVERRLQKERSGVEPTR